MCRMPGYYVAYVGIMNNDKEISAIQLTQTKPIMPTSSPACSTVASLSIIYLSLSCWRESLRFWSSSFFRSHNRLSRVDCVKQFINSYRQFSGMWLIVRSVMRDPTITRFRSVKISKVSISWSGSWDRVGFSTFLSFNFNERAVGPKSATLNQMLGRIQSSLSCHAVMDGMELHERRIKY